MDRVNGAKTMTKFKPLFLVAVVVASITMLAGETWAQCSSCNQAPAFGYPARGGCGGGGCGGGGGGRRNLRLVRIYKGRLLPPFA